MNPLEYHYLALQEVGISLNSKNVRVPNSKPSLIYFEWDIEFFSRNNPVLSFASSQLLSIDTLNIEDLNNLFMLLFNDEKDKIFSNYP